MKKTHVIGQVAQFRDQIRNHFSALPTGLKLPGTLRQISLGTLKRDQFFASWHRFAVVLNQAWFVIEGIEVTACPRAKDDDDVFCLGSEMRVSRCKRLAGVDRRANRGLVARPVLNFVIRCEQAIAAEQTGQGNATESLDHLAHKSSTDRRSGLCVRTMVCHFNSLLAKIHRLGCEVPLESGFSGVLIGQPRACFRG